MGLFDKRDKKRKDDFDSPVEQIDLGAVTTPAPATASGATRADRAEAKAEPEPAVTRAEAKADAEPAYPEITVKKETMPPPMATPDTDDYGIDKAIELMRTLPQENVELVVQVVKFSLESVGIKLPIIIEDAIRRQSDIQGRIGVLKGEIAEHEAEIKQRKEEIERLESDHKETSMVRDRLELAEKLGKPGGKDAGKDTKDAKDAKDAKDGGHGASGSGAIPRVTKQTTPPPMSASSPSTSGLPPHGAPLKKP